MAQITHGIRAILSLPSVYDFVQDALGATRARATLVNEYVRPRQGLRLVDMGCGTGELLHLLPQVEYVGVDLSERYVAAAKERHGERGKFYTGRAEHAEWLVGQKFDIVTAVGVLHHLGDEQVDALVKLSRSLLSPNGRMVTIDPCFQSGQSKIAEYLARRDRGQNVRDERGYVQLLAPHFDAVEGTVRHDLLRIPYTHFVAVSSVGSEEPMLSE